MAAHERDPPRKGGGKKFKCHPNQKVAVVVCVICENVYHEADFNRLKNTKYISETLVICPEHADCENITSIETNENMLNEDCRKLIIQIKLEEKEKAHNKILNDISLSVSNSQIDKHNNTFIDLEDEQSTLIAEILLLRQLNAELQDKNSLLKQLLEKTQVSETTKEKHVSYSEIVSNKNLIRNHPIPTLTIKSKQKKDAKLTYKHVTEKIQNDIIIKIKSVYEKKDGSVIVKCLNKEDALRAENVLTEKLGDNFETELNKISNPRMKVIGIENNMCNEELESDINERNFYSFNSKCKVVHSYKIKKNNSTQAILEVTAELYNYIKNNRNKIYIGYQCCQIYDDLNLSPCYNCGGFGHSTAKCTNKTICLRCAANHPTSECNKQQSICCANCLYSNEKLGKNRDTKHLIFDTEKCEYLRYKINRHINCTDYPINPRIPQYIGSIRNIQENPSLTLPKETIQEKQDSDNTSTKEKKSTRKKKVNYS